MCIWHHPALGCQHRDKALLPQGLSWQPRPCSQQGITATVSVATGNGNMANIPMGLWCSACSSAPPNLLGWKERSGHGRDDKAYHYSRFWIITGFNWTEVTDFTWITESIQWGSADWHLCAQLENAAWTGWTGQTHSLLTTEQLSGHS